MGHHRVGSGWEAAGVSIEGPELVSIEDPELVSIEGNSQAHGLRAEPH